MTIDSIVPVVSQKCRLAEGPLWHPRHAQLYWTDIPKGELFRYDPATGRHERCYSGKVVGGFTFNRDDSIVLFRVKDVCWIDFQQRQLGVQKIMLPGAERFNDVIAAPDGSVFAGTAGKTGESGGLYHLRLDGTVRHLFSGTGFANGMAFSPDLSVLYWTCSTRRKIYAFDYREGEVVVDSRRVFYDAPESEGIPDGLTIDREGNLWSARWDGFQVVVIDPAGKKLDAFSLPRARISSACFGGPKFDRLYVTAAAADTPEKNADECLYEMKGNGLHGPEEFFSMLDPLRPLQLVG